MNNTQTLPLFPNPLRDGLPADPRGMANHLLAADIARHLEALNLADIIRQLDRLAPEKRTEVFVQLSGPCQRALVEALSAADVDFLLAPLPAERRAELSRRTGPGLPGQGHGDPARAMAADEVTEDFHKGALIGKHLGNLGTATVGMLYRKRVLWLVLLVFGNLFSGAGIAAFEDVIAANIVLVFFLPLLVDSGGNAGAQSATLMVRALATGEVVMRDWARLLWRECSVALGLGLTMALAVALLGAIRGGWEISMVVASSMLVIVLVGSLIGMSLPFLFNRLGMDPAVASGPLITSIADAAGVLVYFGIAAAVLGL